MNKIIPLSAVLCSASVACMAATFEYTSEAIAEIEFFYQFRFTSGFGSAEDNGLAKANNVSLKIEINEPLRKNWTYFFNANSALADWKVTLSGGPMNALGNDIARDFDRLSLVFITTDQNYQIVDWNLEYGDTGSDYIEFFSTPSGDFVEGIWEYAFKTDDNPEYQCCRLQGFFGDFAPGTWTTSLPNVVPLPSASLFLLSGLVGFGWLRRRYST